MPLNAAVTGADAATAAEAAEIPAERPPRNKITNKPGGAEQFRSAG